MKYSLVFVVLLFCMIDTSLAEPFMFLDSMGQVCTVINKHRECRPPKNQGEIDRLTKEQNYRDLYASCKFSLFKSWDGEVVRLMDEIKVSKGVNSYFQNQASMAQGDLEKQAYLSSAVIAEARQNKLTYQRLVDQTDISIATNQWCLRCAELKKAGNSDCRAIYP